MNKFMFLFVLATCWSVAHMFPYTNNVSISIELCTQEKAFVQKRSLTTHAALEKIIGNVDQRQPTIALCLSGGGYRAMIASLGFLIAAQEIGLLDAATYVTGLSGSTWLLGSLLAHKTIDPSNKSSLLYYRAQLKTAVSSSLYDNLNVSAIANMLIQKYLQGQSIDLADIWGALIANKLLWEITEGGQTAHFSDCLTPAQQFPYPLFTAVIDPLNKQTGAYGYPCDNPPEYYATHKIVNASAYEWAEISPHAIESDYLQSQAKLTAFGNKFSNKNRLTKWPEQTLGYLFGICGSPYATTLGDIVTLLATSVDNYFLKKILTAMAQWHFLYEGRFAAATPPNFTYKIKPSPSPMSYKKTLTLIDAGFDFNIPLPPLLKAQRSINIIFICDVSSSASLNAYPQLHLAADYAKKHNIKFPALDKPFFQNNDLLIFKDVQDPQAPTIVYIPNKIQSSTLQLQYKPEEFEELCSNMEQTVSNNRNILYEVIRQQPNLTTT